MKDKSGIYFVEDNKFLFTSIIVGRKATARFKISNINKVSFGNDFAYLMRSLK